MKKPVILPLIALVTGIITAAAMHIPASALYLFLFPCMVCLSLSLIKKMPFLAVITLVLSFYFLGALHINLYCNPKSSKKDICRFTGEPGTVTIEGVISHPPRISHDKTRLVMESVRILREKTALPVSGNVLLTLKGSEYRYAYGDYIRAETKLRRPHSFKNPGGFDYERYLLYQGIGVRGFVGDPSRIVRIRQNCGNSMRGMIERYRTLIRDTISGTVPEPESRILHALILGEHEGIPDRVRDNFNRAGVSHLLAISGLHVGIVASLFFFVIKTLMKLSECLLLRFNIIKVSAFLSIMPIIGYASIAGFRISTIRATIMILAFTVALLIGRERDLLNILAFAALSILVFDPTSLFDVSFQLSFAAAASILMIVPMAQSLLYRKKRNDMNRFLRSACSIALFVTASLAATAGTAPLIALYFNRLSTLTLLSNLFLIPLIGFLVLPLGIVSTIMVLISPSLAALSFWFAGFFVALARAIIDFMASFPLSIITMATPSLLEITLYYLFLICLIGLIAASLSGKRRLPYGIILAVILSIFVTQALWFHYQDRCGSNLEITFIDVGQGSSTLIKFPGGEKMLVDGGGLYDTFDIGEYVVAPFLLHEKIKGLDVVVLTHPDRDHLGGLPYILEHFETGEVWTNGESSGTAVYHDFIATIDHAAIPHRIISTATEPVLFGNTKITILNPPEAVDGKNPGTCDSTNDNGIVMKIENDTIALLLSADISSMVEHRLSEGDRFLKSTALLVPHHGSRTSSSQSFVEAVRPDIVIISCGFENTFGLPHPEVIERYENIGADIFRTDLHGAVTLIAGEDRIEVRSERRRNGAGAN